MPTATPFTALGRGNGFPFCPVTRSFNSTIHAGEYTLEEVMSFVWNLESFTIDITTDVPSNYSETFGQDGWTNEVPMLRVCNSLPDVGYDSSSEKYHIKVPEIIFNIDSFEQSLISGTNFGFTITDEFGGSWGISPQSKPFENVISATITFNFYTY